MSDHGLVGSKGRRGNPYDNAQAESFMDMLTFEAAYQTECASVAEVAADLPRFLDDMYGERQLDSALGCRSPAEFERQHAKEGDNAPA